MQMEMPSAAALAGERLLGEIEETNLDEVRKIHESALFAQIGWLG